MGSSGEGYRGVRTAEQWASTGVSAGQLQRLVRKGLLVPLRRGVYAGAGTIAVATGDPGLEHLVQVTAALLVNCSTAAASHRSAALIHGLDVLGRPPADAIWLTRSPGGRGSRSSPAGLHLHNAELPAEHVTTCHGIPVTTVARTVVDIARASPFRDGVVIADSALHARKTTKAELEAVVAHCRRWPGASRAERVVAFSDRLAESVLESVSRVVFHERGLPLPALQVNVGGASYIGRVDFLWPEYATIAEADGALKYADTRRAIEQLKRDQLLRNAGFEVVHYTWSQIFQEPDQVVSWIWTAFRRPRRT